LAPQKVEELGARLELSNPSIEPEHGGDLMLALRRSDVWAAADLAL
jgi:hypothetical protein